MNGLGVSLDVMFSQWVLQCYGNGRRHFGGTHISPESLASTRARLNDSFLMKALG